MKPLTLSEAQLGKISAAAKSLRLSDRSRFVAVVELLQDVEIGDGVVSAIVKETQRAFVRAPQFDADD